MLQKKITDNSGLTLVEMLVVIGIITIMSLAVFLGGSTIGSPQKLQMSAQEMVSNIRKMQSYVLNLQDHSGSFPDGGWGVYFDMANHRYYLFADMNKDYFWQSGETAREFALPKGVVINDIQIDSTTKPLGCIDFSPPDPKTHICESTGPACDNATAGQIEISLSNGNATKKVIVNKYGLVDVEN